MYTHVHTHTHTHPSEEYRDFTWQCYPDSIHQVLQWRKEDFVGASRALLLALRRALLALHDVSDSDGVVFSDDEIDVQAALGRFRDLKEELWDPPLPWDRITYRTGDRRTSWMEEWRDCQLQGINCQLHILPEYFFFSGGFYQMYLWDRLRLDWFANLTTMATVDYVLAYNSTFCCV